MGSIGIRAEQATIRFRFFEPRAASRIKDVIQRAGHFCKQRLEIGWDMHSIAALSAVDWLEVKG